MMLTGERHHMLCMMCEHDFGPILERDCAQPCPRCGEPHNMNAKYHVSVHILTPERRGSRETRHRSVGRED
jgi:uncharacterized CHY-type Zn-finger protein